MRLIDLELDLDVFAGPFDLLLTLILREEIDLLEVDLAEIVISYIDHLEQRGELDLEAATEFLVLIAALLELKSRLMLPGEEPEEIELDPGEAAEELLARLLDAHRYRAAAAHLREPAGASRTGYRFRSAPLPPSLRRASLKDASAVYDPARLARGDRRPADGCPSRSTCATSPIPKVTVAERLAHLRALLRPGSFTFDEAVARADRVTIAVTLFAVLELYKQGELTWAQAEPFGEITIEAAEAERPAACRHDDQPRGQTLEALLFLSSEPVDADGARATRPAPSCTRWSPRSSGCASTTSSSGAGSCCASSAGAGCCPPTPTPRRRRGGCWRKPRTPPLTPAQAETLAIVAYLQPVSRPEIARIRGVNAESAASTLLERGVDRGGRPLAVRRRAVPDDRAVPAPVRPGFARRAAGRQPLRSLARARGGAPRAAAAGRRGARGAA